MIPRALTVYLERSIIWTRKNFFMGDFVRNSLEILESSIDEAIANVDPEKKIGIFGIGDSANVVHRRMVAHGCPDIFFIATNPQKDSHRGCPLVDFNSDEIFSADVIIASSLSNSQRQKELLVEKGYGGEIVTLKNMSHISTIISNDTSTYKLIEKMQGIHAGIPAFVIGNGPSLNQTDPKLINNDFVTFAGNGIINIEGFAPNYYFALDPNALKMWSDNMSKLNSVKMFPAHLRKTITTQYPNVSQKNNIYFPVCYQRDGDFEINNWKSLAFESGQTVVCPMIQFAMLMKCDPIFLIGVDLSYGSGKNYFSDKYHAADMPAYRQSETSIYNERMGRGIERLAKACRTSGIRLYNCAPSRNLPFLEEMEFEQALAYRTGSKLRPSVPGLAGIDEATQVCAAGQEKFL